MTRHTYLVTEGVHDVTFLGKLLDEQFGFRKATTAAQLDDAWRRWVDRFAWPHDRRIDRLSVPAPVFYVRPEAEHFVALVNAGGITRIASAIDVGLQGFLLDGTALDALGVVLDSDEQTPDERFQQMATKLEQLELTKPLVIGGMVNGPPRIGVFVLPDGHAKGTLEDILLAAGRLIYPALHADAEAFVATSMTKLDLLEPKEGKPIKEAAGQKKATVAAMTAVLKPGRAVPATLEDHRWVSEQTLDLAEMNPCISFLAELLGLPKRAQKGGEPQPAGGVA